jgi:negative regulator of flagellin synthesis FlgM
MKIESSNTSTIAVAQSGATRAPSSNDAQGGASGAAPVASANATGNAGSSSTVSLSALPTASGPDIDTASVESVKAALRNGTYQIDSGKIADGMLGNARDLLQPRAR